MFIKPSVAPRIKICAVLPNRIEKPVGVGQEALQRLSIADFGRASRGPTEISGTREFSAKSDWRNRGCDPKRAVGAIPRPALDVARIVGFYEVGVPGMHQRAKPKVGPRQRRARVDLRLAASRRYSAGGEQLIAPVMAMPFDTLKLARRLESAGFPAQQAGDMAEAIAEAVSQLATKADLRDLEQRMTIKFGGMIVVAVGVILAGFKLIH